MGITRCRRIVLAVLTVAELLTGSAPAALAAPLETGPHRWHSCRAKAWTAPPWWYWSTIPTRRGQRPSCRCCVTAPPTRRGASACCWSTRAARVRRPETRSAAGAPTVLVLGTRLDSQTPYPWARAMTDSLHDAVLLTVDGIGHGAHGSSGECVDGAVDTYLFTGRTPRRARPASSSHPRPQRSHRHHRHDRDATSVCAARSVSPARGCAAGVPGCCGGREPSRRSMSGISGRTGW